MTLPSTKLKEKTGQAIQKHGIHSLSDKELLLGLLAYCKDPAPEETADTLLARFGSLYGVLKATCRELAENGLSHNAALLFSSVLPIFSRAATWGKDAPGTLSTATQVGTYLKKLFLGCRVETVYLLLLDKNFALMETKKVGEGSINTTNLNCRSITEAALFSGAVFAMIAHNHPGGRATPSRDDLMCTDQLGAALETIGVPLLEHFVVGEQDYLPLIYAKTGGNPLCPKDFYDAPFPRLETPNGR